MKTLNDESKKISVIVPTYNRASNVVNIIEKLLLQDYANTEIIIVNDGSTDDTTERLQQFEDNRLKLIYKDNGGLSSARNQGIEAATGDYILFIDDDDEIPLDFISSFMKDDLNDIDLVIDSYCNKVDNKKSVPVSFPRNQFTNYPDTIDFLCSRMPDNPYCFFVHGKRFKTKIIIENNIRFSNRLRFVEDRPFVIDYILNSKTCVITDNHKYIVKSISNSQYRLSKGLKSANWLWQNIKESYEYLVDVEKKVRLSSIRRYADNYLATRTLDYLFSPYCKGTYPSDIDMFTIREMSAYVRKNVSMNNISSSRGKIYLYLIRTFHNRASSIWNIFEKTREIGGKIKNEFFKK